MNVLLSQTSTELNKIINNPQVQEIKGRAVEIYSSNIGWLEAISIIITVVLLGSTLFFAIKTGWLALRIDRVRDVVLKSNLPKKRSIKAWQNVKKLFFAGDDNSLKLAILEADKTLDEALKAAGFIGENIGERLKQVNKAQLPNIEEVWEAHKLRNRLVHETDFKLNRSLARKALLIYEKTFEDLGLLD